MGPPFQSDCEVCLAGTLQGLWEFANTRFHYSIHVGNMFFLFLSIRGFARLCLKLGFDAPHVFVVLPVADFSGRFQLSFIFG